MPYNLVHLDRERRFALERDSESGAPVLSIPVSNRLCDYEEWYRVSEEEFDRFLADPDEAMQFAASCGRREQDDRLVLKPGRDRGVY